MKIRFDGYPSKLSFEIKRKTLPAFKYGCKTRTKIARDMLKKNMPEDCIHGANDFIVEAVTKTKNGEVWHLGS